MRARLVRRSVTRSVLSMRTTGMLRFTSDASWSRMSAMSGLQTTVGRGSSMAATW
jgi:fructose-1-phosphate kinase PfkB-like protein